MANLEGIARKYLNMLPRGTEIPSPMMQTVDTPSMGWAGLAEWHHNKQVRGLIKVQKTALKDQDTLERVIAHEVCHYWEFYTTFEFGEGDPNDLGHSAKSLWAKAAKIINGKMGDPNFVTELSDTSYVFRNSKEFYILVAQGMSELGWDWCSKVTPAMTEAIQTLMNNGPVAILKTDRDSFLSSKAKLPNIGVPKGDKAMNQLLQEAFRYAKKWSPDQFNEALQSAPKF
jgi:hypothetical protein